ncbi:metalloregulator ArsR/SmtB family transcription factor [Patulibacter sp. NPDC049589]|uniref:ArsR/SmtB family transcription factor n=1 Tax=Patulibacter sp. NPDC049589 TaxID=3154731 RepID=UPI003445EB96
MGREGPGRRPGGQPCHPDPTLTDDDLTELLRALAHEERRRLLRACLAAPQAAGDLVAASDLTGPSVSEHLKVLRKTGLLILERDGRFRRYRTNPELLRTIAAAVGDLGD